MKETKLPEYAVGIDMGTNSIGWSVVEEHKGKPTRFVDCGSRIFIRSVEDKTPTPKNQKRRNMRLLRRGIERRHRRKMRLRNYLIGKGFLPESLKGELNPEVELNKLGNPYEIRAKALDNELTPHEFGRAILHLGTRRGFLSNRKTGFGDLREDLEVQNFLEGLEDEEDKNKKKKPDKEESAFKTDIENLRKEIDKNGKRTLGEYLATLTRKRNRGEHNDRRTDRLMYQEEFDKIFQKQSAFNPDLYTKDVKDAVEEIIFFQRPITWDKGKIGKCSLEKNKRRIDIGRLEFQQFRYWQDINNLRWYDTGTGEEKEPTQEQKNLIAEALEQKNNLTWTKLKKDYLNVDNKTKINLEKVEGKSSKGIKGNTTAYKIREIIGNAWDSFDEKKQKELVEDLISYQSKKALKKRLQNYWKFDLEKAVKLAVLELEDGHGNLSLKAINRILPHLKEGKIYNPDAVEAAGYKEITVSKKENRDTLPIPPDIPNPIVSKALFEVRRVVNALIKEYGKPTAIRIEMARDLEANTEKYKKALKRQQDNTKANEEAEEKYKEIRKKNPHLNLKTFISHQDKLKYRLWKESGQRCSYSGKTIDLTTLWSADVEIDHILPYSRSLDNSYMNKVVCFVEENRKKGNRTPWEAFGDMEQWETIEGTLSPDSYPDAKSRRIRTRKMEGIDDFINSQLTDARYIAKETGKYMRDLSCDVTFTKGGATSWLRHQWGLNSILGDTGEKNRSDHRHHAIDATVIALTNRSLYKQIVHLASQAGDDSISPEHGLEVPRVLDNLRDKLEDAVNQIIVSHSTNRKITGAFHEETVYGIREESGKKGIVVRKNLTDMSDKNLKNIVCPIIREGFESYVNMRGGLQTAQKELREKPFKHPKTGDDVRRARVWVTKRFYEKSYWQNKDKNNGKTLGTMIYGNNHHVEIIQNLKNGKYEGVFVTNMEAAKRARITKESIVQTNHGENWKFIMSLCINDTVSVEKMGKRKFYRVQKISSSGQITLRLHTASTDKDKNEEILKLINPLMNEYKIQSESINALGHRLTATD